MESEHSKETNITTLDWYIWDELILSRVDESTSFLQAVLKFRQISRPYRNEIDTHIRSRIDDPTVKSAFDRILLVHVMFGTLQEVQRFFKKHQPTLDYVTKLRPIRAHQQQLKKELYSIDVIRWLIDFGLDARGAVVNDWHIISLPIDWNMFMLEHGASCEIHSPKIFKSADEFRRYWKFCDRTSPQIISTLVSNLFNYYDFLQIRTDERKEFIMNEYRSTSSNNLFKQLPLEIVQQIVSYQLDDYLWLELADIMIRDVPDHSLDIEFWSSQFHVVVPKFIWKFWDKFSEKTKARIVQEMQCVLLHNADDEFFDSLLKFFRLPIMANRFPSPANKVAPDILRSALYSNHPKALELVKTLAETQQYQPGDYRCPYTDRGQQVWHAMYTKDNSKTLEYLIEIDSWPLHNDYVTFDQWLNNNPGLKPEIVEFVRDCLKKKGKI